MIDAVFLVDSAAGRRNVNLRAYLDRAAEERATLGALTWIKNLRHAVVDGQPLRRRFTFREDSLWWFAELYLHKQQVIAHIFRTISALGAMLDQERPTELRLERGGSLARGIAPQIAAARGIRYGGPNGFGRPSAVRLAAIEARAVALNTAALASRLRARATRAQERPPRAAAFVHRAFWRADAGDGSAEAYIGPVLTALEQRLDASDLAYVSVGPPANFRARRWWHALRRTSSGAACPVEAYAPLPALDASRHVWRERHQIRRVLWKSTDLRDRAVIEGCDCWPVIRDELAGIALLQWPWSARAMDEAGAALDALQPHVVLTYAEAGGWGRAIMLECRRRGIPSVGLQHGYIYRHWLNYRHEPDEMLADPNHPADRGFPRPTTTLLFDEYAAHHLAHEGAFPRPTLQVTGSPRLDALADEVSRLTPEERDRALAAAGAASKTLVLVATKQREASGVLEALVEAAGSLPDVRVAIKTHPAETPDVYANLVSGRPHVRVLDAAQPLAPLLGASRAVVTVNSTVALDAAVLDIPALVIGLPNNLTPFVDAGVMAGTASANPADIARALHQILYDEEFRGALAVARRAFLSRFNIAADGRAAERAAEAVLTLAERAGER
jgi:hypothetical protein